jgi:UDP-2,4-diacetamido-2,4,6-trideoxy-beta-L-altropyranose hydrolase
MVPRCERLLVRADADARMGTGHLMRCLAMAQAWHDAGGRVSFLTACRLPELNARLTSEGVQVEPLSSEPGSDNDAEETREAAQRLGAGWVVLDGYHFTGAFQRRIRGEGVRLLALDDYGHADHYAADLVLNQNLYAAEDLYRAREPYTSLLLGTRFALLRREFWPWRGWKRVVPAAARKVLVTLGGSDPDRVTLKVVEALGKVQLPGLEAMVVVGGGNLRGDELEAAARRHEGIIHLRSNVTDMPELMAWADVAVAAGGTTTWERALLGLPSLVIVLAENQRKLADAVRQAGLGWDLGWHERVGVPALVDSLERLLANAEERSTMARRGPELVDGHGAARVTALLAHGEGVNRAHAVPGREPTES